MEPMRITPEQAREKILARKAMLVCAYEDAAKFNNARLEGAMSIRDFRAMEQSLSKEQEIIFYCA